MTSQRRVRRLARAAGVECVHPRPYVRTTLRTRRPGTGWPTWSIAISGRRPRTSCGPAVSPISTRSAIHTFSGFAYLATVIDLFSNKVVGWMVADHMRTGLVLDALDLAHGPDPDHALAHLPARRPQPAHLDRLGHPPGRQRPPRRHRPAPQNPGAAAARPSPAWPPQRRHNPGATIPRPSLEAHRRSPRPRHGGPNMLPGTAMSPARQPAPNPAPAGNTPGARLNREGSWFAQAARLV